MSDPAPPPEQASPDAMNSEPTTRPLGRIGAFAPGNYLCKCIACGETFGGDKRALNCLNCAIDALSLPPNPPSREVLEALDFLTMAVEYAYKTGLHEVGYDPVHCLAAALQAATSPSAAVIISVAEPTQPASAAQPGEHGESKEGLGADPTLSGSQAPPTAELNSSDELSETHESGPDVKFSAPPTAVPAGWLIERGGQWYAAAPHTDWTIKQAIADLHQENWTWDADAALRFARKEDAETLIRFVGWQHATATEHAWIAAAPPPPSDAPLSCADAMELARDMLHDEWLRTGDSETLAAHYVVADALAIFVSEPFTSPPSVAPSREEIAGLIREHVRPNFIEDDEGELERVELGNLNDAADSILALFARGAG